MLGRFAVLLLAVVGCASDDLPPRDPRSADDAEIVTAAEVCDLGARRPAARRSSAAHPSCAPPPPHATPPPPSRAPQFAMDELKKLSDSGVYETLSLHKIASAATQTGVFHFNYFLQLEMASPHFKDGAPSAAFDVMVMRNLEDGVFSFAIDEFPVMDEDAIEEHWIEKVERHRRLREESFAAMEAEALEDEEREAKQKAAGGAGGGGGGGGGGGAKDEL